MSQKIDAQNRINATVKQLKKSVKKMSQKIDSQNRINATVKQLEKDVNNSLVTYKDIARAFLQVHPYLLNEIAKGVCSAVNTRKSDGRIHINGLTYILNE